MFTDAELDLRAPSTADMISGARWSHRGVELSGDDARLVFTAEWPFATHARLLVSSDQDATVTVGSGNALGAPTPIGTARVPRGAEPTWIELELPPKTFDSGINDWILRADGGSVVVSAIAIEDRAPRTLYGRLEALPQGIMLARSTPGDVASRRGTL